MIRGLLKWRMIVKNERQHIAKERGKNIGQKSPSTNLTNLQTAGKPLQQQQQLLAR